MDLKPLASSPAPAHSDQFHSALSTWFQKVGKDLPWRKTENPWAILVSEIMLQQTTVASVIANRRFERFLEEFPDLQTISAAPEEQLLKAWEGLGYYNRVRNLQRAASAILELHGGVFPKDAESLEKLPGIGKYTAGAVSSFAFNRPAPIVDANIARVLSRIFDYHEPVDSTAGLKQIWVWAEALLDRKNPRRHNSAIMELGQTHCSPKSPDCIACPVANFCQCRDPLSLPVKKARRKTIQVDEHAIFHLKKGRLLLAKEDGGRRKGFWRLPLREAETVAHLEPVSTHRYAITHHRVTLFLYKNETSPEENEAWISLDKLEDLPIASPVRRAIEASL